MQLAVCPKSAKIAKNTDMIGKMDPYVEVTIGGTKQRTQVATSAGQTPVWNDQLSFVASPSDIILLRIYDKDIIGSDYIGEVSIPVTSVINAGGQIFNEYEFVSKDNSGTLTVQILQTGGMMNAGGFNQQTYPNYNQQIRPNYNQPAFTTTTINNPYGRNYAQGMGQVLTTPVPLGFPSTGQRLETMAGAGLGGAAGAGIGAVSGAATGFGMGAASGANMGAQLGSYTGTGIGTGLGAGIGAGMGALAGAGLGAVTGLGSGAVGGAAAGAATGAYLANPSAQPSSQSYIAVPQMNQFNQTNSMKILPTSSSQMIQTVGQPGFYTTGVQQSIPPGGQFSQQTIPLPNQFSQQSINIPPLTTGSIIPAAPGAPMVSTSQVTINTPGFNPAFNTGMQTTSSNIVMPLPPNMGSATVLNATNPNVLGLPALTQKYDNPIHLQMTGPQRLLNQEQFNPNPGYKAKIMPMTIVETRPITQEVAPAVGNYAATHPYVTTPVPTTVSQTQINVPGGYTQTFQGTPSQYGAAGFGLSQPQASMTQITTPGMGFAQPQTSMTQITTPGYGAPVQTVTQVSTPGFAGQPQTFVNRVGVPGVQSQFGMPAQTSMTVQAGVPNYGFTAPGAAQTVVQTTVAPQNMNFPFPR